LLTAWSTPGRSFSHCLRTEYNCSATGICFAAAAAIARQGFAPNANNAAVPAECFNIVLREQFMVASPKSGKTRVRASPQ
jgi:hypothetical protein